MRKYIFLFILFVSSTVHALTMTTSGAAAGTTVLIGRQTIVIDGAQVVLSVSKFCNANSDAATIVQFNGLTNYTTKSVLMRIGTGSWFSINQGNSTSYNSGSQSWVGDLSFSGGERYSSVPKYGGIVTITVPAWTKNTAIAYLPIMGDSGTITCVAIANPGGKDVVQYYDNETGKWVTYKTLNGSNDNYAFSLTYDSDFFAKNPGIDPEDVRWRLLQYGSDGSLRWNNKMNVNGGSNLGVTNNSTDDDYTLLDAFNSQPDDISYTTPLLANQGISTSDGGTSWGNGGSGTALNGQSVVDLTGTATDTLAAANTQTGIQTNLLTSSSIANSHLSAIENRVSELVAKSGQSSSGGGGLTTAQNDLLQNISDEVEGQKDARDRETAFKDSTVTHDDGTTQTVEDAEKSIIKRLSATDEDFAGVQQTAQETMEGNSHYQALETEMNELTNARSSVSPQSTGNPGSVFNITLFGKVYDCDPLHNNGISAGAMLIRNIIAWFLIMKFWKWLSDAIHQHFSTVACTPTIVDNAAGATPLVGSASALVKATILVTFLVSVPVVITAICTSGISITGIAGTLKSLVAPDLVSSTNTFVSAAVYICQGIFPIAVMVELMVLRVTARLWLTGAFDLTSLLWKLIATW